MLTHGSLFAGIGGFDLGFERAGIKTLWQVEIDPFCRKVLEKNFPDAERFDDIRGCGRHNLRSVDVITGGFPCQDISNAGKRAGIGGERSGLWTEMRRIICELRPRFVIVENVAALLGRGMERVLGDLAEGGYDAEWDCLPAYAFGAEHERERVFTIAYPNRSWQLQPKGSEQALGGWTCNRSKETVADSMCSGLSLRGADGADGADARIFGKGLGFAIGTEMAGLERCGASRWRGDVHGIPSRMDRIKSLGNAVVPQIAEWIGRRIIVSCTGGDPMTNPELMKIAERYFPVSRTLGHLQSVDQLFTAMSEANARRTFTAPNATLYPDGNFAWDLCVDCGQDMRQALLSAKGAIAEANRSRAEREEGKGK